MTGFDVDAAADAVLPLGGPYTPETLAAAAGLTAELIRRLNHATFDPPVEYPSQVDRVVSRLSAVAHGLPQTCRQLAGVLGRFETVPGVYADAEARGATPGEVIGRAQALLSMAAGHAQACGEELSAARNLTARLGIHTEEES